VYLLFYYNLKSKCKYFETIANKQFVYMIDLTIKLSNVFET